MAICVNILSVCTSLRNTIHLVWISWIKNFIIITGFALAVLHYLLSWSTYGCKTLLQVLTGDSIIFAFNTCSIYHNLMPCFAYRLVTILFVIKWKLEGWTLITLTIRKDIESSSTLLHNTIGLIVWVCDKEMITLLTSSILYNFLSFFAYFIVTSSFLWVCDFEVITWITATIRFYIFSVFALYWRFPALRVNAAYHIRGGNFEIWTYETISVNLYKITGWAFRSFTEFVWLRLIRNLILFTSNTWPICFYSFKRTTCSG